MEITREFEKENMEDIDCKTGSKIAITRRNLKTGKGYLLITQLENNEVEDVKMDLKNWEITLAYSKLETFKPDLIEETTQYQEVPVDQESLPIKLYNLSDKEVYSKEIYDQSHSDKSKLETSSKKSIDIVELITLPMLVPLKLAAKKSACSLKIDIDTIGISTSKSNLLDENVVATPAEKKIPSPISFEGGILRIPGKCFRRGSFIILQIQANTTKKIDELGPRYFTRYLKKCGVYQISELLFTTPKSTTQKMAHPLYYGILWLHSIFADAIKDKERLRSIDPTWIRGYLCDILNNITHNDLQELITVIRSLIVDLEDMDDRSYLQYTWTILETLVQDCCYILSKHFIKPTDNERRLLYMKYIFGWQTVADLENLYILALSSNVPIWGLDLKLRRPLWKTVKQFGISLLENIIDKKVHKQRHRLMKEIESIEICIKEEYRTRKSLTYRHGSTILLPRTAMGALIMQSARYVDIIGLPKTVNSRLFGSITCLLVYTSQLEIGNSYGGRSFIQEPSWWYILAMKETVDKLNLLVSRDSSFNTKRMLYNMCVSERSSLGETAWKLLASCYNGIPYNNYGSETHYTSPGEIEHTKYYVDHGTGLLYIRDQSKYGNLTWPIGWVYIQCLVYQSLVYVNSEIREGLFTADIETRIRLRKWESRLSRSLSRELKTQKKSCGGTKMLRSSKTQRGLCLNHGCLGGCNTIEIALWRIYRDTYVELFGPRSRKSTGMPGRGGCSLALYRSTVAAKQNALELQTVSRL